MSHPSVASTLIGMATVEEVKINVHAAKSSPDPYLLGELKMAIGNGFATT